jgi:hypothetical protein
MTNESTRFFIEKFCKQFATLTLNFIRVQHAILMQKFVLNQ